MKLVVFTVLICCVPAIAMLEESGTLRGFLLGQNDSSAYDNWVSHISEGIARPGFNHYGPDWFDPQTNGFGSYQVIPNGAAGDSTLARWKGVFRHALRNEWPVVDSLLLRQDSVWNYDLVHFSDTAEQHEYYMIRERLDSSYVDVNIDSVEGDEVIGSFPKGWGLYVFHSLPRFPKLGIQMPHPEDDFVSIPVGIELFLQAQARVLMIAGAGREVMWDSSGGAEYNNNRSLSDPSRSRRTVFAICHEAMCEEWGRAWNSGASVLQLHSYDHATHRDLMDIQMCAYRDDFSPNMPLRDRAAHRDIVHGLPRYPVTGIDGDDSIVAEVNEYVALWSNPGYSWYGEGEPIPLQVSWDLTGAVPNQQATFSHVGHNVEVDPETFLHIELDEYPDQLWMPENWERWLPCTAPVDEQCFTHVLDYYQAFVSAVDSGYAWWMLEVDSLPPPVTNPFQATLLANGTVYLRWSPPAADRFFDTYFLYYDTLEVSPQSPYHSRTEQAYRSLWNFETKTISVLGLRQPISRYRFAMKSRDLWGHESELSPSIGITDSTIHNLVIRVWPDTVEVCWSPQLNDSIYHIYEMVSGDSLNSLVVTPLTSYRFAADDTVLVKYEVIRVLRR